jgi:hypothetical protein
VIGLSALPTHHAADSTGAPVACQYLQASAAAPFRLNLLGLRGAALGLGKRLLRTPITRAAAHTALHGGAKRDRPHFRPKRIIR